MQKRKGSELLYKVSVSPHIRTKNTTAVVMRDVLIALLPALVAACLIFGLRSLLLTAVSVTVCVLLEFIWNKLFKQPVTVGDLSAAVTGALIAFNVPVSMPIWQLIVGDAAAIIVCKMLFGGLGCNFMNPALVGRIVMFFSFTGSMTDYQGHLTEWAIKNLPGRVELVSGATPLSDPLLRHADLPQLLFGAHGGVLGETCAIALLLGGIYLIVRRVITPTVPVVFIVGVAVFSWLFGIDQPLLAPLSGGVMLGAIFMATDYVTSPSTERGRAVFAVGIAFITVAIRRFSSNAEGVSFAILLMNVLVPYIDAIFATKPFGAAKKPKKGGAK